MRRFIACFLILSVLGAALVVALHPAPPEPVTWLALIGPNITDADLAKVRDKTELRCLFLNGSKITDAGLVNLEKLPSLVFLNLSYTKVTEAGVARLQQCLRRCSIVR